ncbi:PXA domain-domain-containing protein [Yarrowia lipolytica]|uniref:PXA domain-domain-containing protein n=1 Tax=Yarrowia lipolytica TaxID=4952 RepID=A0A371C634_YARLL|nr:PXA domain-domain-containing protein [Yarrowia lipolytica]RDW38449.1 PXA domain-domain-containing protein [Yarrowia lipolytica]RDW44934.1 PXA domain-domain-containing protein [Yarrowia lipolytica]RDW51758.1 PXA domain-domain-containing protein [Yarrowia lipolytica]
MTSTETAASLDHLVRQVLLPDSEPSKPVLELLPVPTSCSDAVNTQWYALAALICRHMVQSWYSRISDDPGFVTEMVEVLAKISRDVDTRLQTIDYETALLDGLPYLIDSHFEAVDRAKALQGSAFLPVNSLSEGLRVFRPHRAISGVPDDHSELVYQKLLAQQITTILLKRQKIDSKVAHAFISAILHDVVLTTLFERLSEPWMLYEIIIKVCDLLPDNSKTPEKNDNGGGRVVETLGYLVSNGVTIATETFYAARTYVRSGFDFYEKNSVDPTLADQQDEGDSDKEKENERKTRIAPKPVTSRYFFQLLVNISNIRAKKPLLASTLSYLSVFLEMQPLAVSIRNVVVNSMNKHVLREKTAELILRSARITLFPNNGPMGAPRVLPTVLEQYDIRQNARDALSRVFPPFVGNVTTDIDLWLDHLSNKEVNKLLLYYLCDYLLQLAFPELSEKVE